MVTYIYGPDEGDYVKVSKAALMNYSVVLKGVLLANPTKSRIELHLKFPAPLLLAEEAKSNWETVEKVDNEIAVAFIWYFTENNPNWSAQELPNLCHEYLCLGRSKSFILNIFSKLSSFIFSCIRN